MSALARRVDEEAEAVAAADDGERRFGRAEHHDRIARRRGAAEARWRSLGAEARSGPETTIAGEPAEGRQAGRAPRLDLAGVEGLAVAGDDRRGSPDAPAR